MNSDSQSSTAYDTAKGCRSRALHQSPDRSGAARFRGLCGNTDLVIAALLHDTIEDAGVTEEELAERFGADVAHLVAEITDDKSLPKQERKRLQIVNAPKKSVRAQTIKLADKISNLRAILSSPPIEWTDQRKTEYFDWARQVVDGLSAPNPVLKAEFEKTLNAPKPWVASRN